MIIVHAGVYDDQLLLWGETPRESGVPSPKQSGRKRQNKLDTPQARLQPLPYDAGIESLSAALKEAGFSFASNKGRTESITAWLPTLDSQPIASSPLIAEPPQSRAKTVLAPWIVAGLRLSTEQAVEVL